MSIDLSGLAKDAAAYVKGGGIVISAKTNYTPEIVLYSGSGDSDATQASKGVLSILGFRGGIVIRTADGYVLQSFGDPQPLEHWRLAMVAVALGGLGILIIRGLQRARR